jgi:hypothetical protein
MTIYKGIIFELIVLILVSLVFFIIDTNKCHAKYSNIVLYINHFLNIFANFGWISNNKIVLCIYLLSPIIIIIHWKTNDNKCILSQIHNKFCRRDDDKMFDDMFNIIKLKTFTWWNNWGHHLYLLISFSIALYKIIFC